MSSSLTDHQRQSLDAYEDFRIRYPKAFRGRQRRPIVLDRSRLEAYAAEHGVVLGIAATTRYAHFVIDLVESSDHQGEKFVHTYLRAVNRGQLDGGTNVAVIATIEDPSLGRTGDIVLVEQERHATGSIEAELPRGFGELGLTGEQNALTELKQETGFIGSKPRLLGTALIDSGFTDSEVSFFHVPVVAKQASAREPEEAIVRLRLASPAEIWEEITAGRIRDSFTLQALALYEKLGRS
jgi:ADP-ribose pyrophosphatase